MSDDLGKWSPNIGATLPDGRGATHNSALSPVFTWQGGHTELDNGLYAAGRGAQGRYWSQTTYGDAKSYIAYLSLYIFEPSSSGVHQVARSLRCLVSTNNG